MREVAFALPMMTSAISPLVEVMVTSTTLASPMKSATKRSAGAS
jgi:hypothetical protein